MCCSLRYFVEVSCLEGIDAVFFQTEFYLLAGVAFAVDDIQACGVYFIIQVGDGFHHAGVYLYVGGGEGTDHAGEVVGKAEVIESEIDHLFYWQAIIKSVAMIRHTHRVRNDGAFRALFHAWR